MRRIWLALAQSYCEARARRAARDWRHYSDLAAKFSSRLQAIWNRGGRA